jgi:hypothetical protein
MFDTFKFLVGVVKDEVKKNVEDWVEYTLYSKPYDFSKVSGGSGYSGKQIRVIGPIVTIY